LFTLKQISKSVMALAVGEGTQLRVRAFLACMRPWVWFPDPAPKSVILSTLLITISVFISDR
jgi:hypothetical protein